MARPLVLVIAGWDSSTGAGLARDLRVLERCGVAAVGAVTAVTAQSHTGVRAIHPVPAHIVREQIAAAVASQSVRAIKIGMLANAEIVAAVIDGLQSAWDTPVGHATAALPRARTAIHDITAVVPETHTSADHVMAAVPRANTPVNRVQTTSPTAQAPSSARVPVVLDPVLAASSGRALLDVDGRALMKERLFPLATLITPNIPEAAALLGTAPAANETAAIEQAKALIETGAQAVLMKGGHAATAECTDILVTATGHIERFTAPRMAAKPRGTGCALASAIAAGLAHGMPLIEACRFAKNDLTTEIAALEPAA
jgi:hydroxymethylpyrimidine/phosphomethylpyrimidine kinase